MKGLAREGVAGATSGMETRVVSFFGAFAPESKEGAVLAGISMRTVSRLTVDPRSGFGGRVIRIVWALEASSTGAAAGGSSSGIEWNSFLFSLTPVARCQLICLPLEKQMHSQKRACQAGISGPLISGDRELSLARFFSIPLACWDESACYWWGWFYWISFCGETPWGRSCGFRARRF